MKVTDQMISQAVEAGLAERSAWTIYEFLGAGGRCIAEDSKRLHQLSQVRTTNPAALPIQRRDFPDEDSARAFIDRRVVQSILESVL